MNIEIPDHVVDEIVARATARVLADLEQSRPADSKFVARAELEDYLAGKPTGRGAR